MTNRTVSRWTRVYMGGYPVHCYTQTIGPLGWAYAEHDMTTLCDAVTGYLPGMPTISLGTLNGVLSPDTAGLHAIASGAGVSWPVSVALGMGAEPVNGNPTFNGYFQQLAYTAAGEGPVTVAVPFGMWDVNSLLNYSRPWGILQHAYGAETGANSGSGPDNGAATTAGGYMVYHLYTSNGTVTLSIDDSANGSSFAALSGMTTGAIDASVTPKTGIIQIGTTATIRRYTRWQLSFGTANTATFVLSLVRG